MKMIIAIVNNDDSSYLMEKLTENNVSATKLASTGGFLRAGNVTLIIGTDENRVDEIMDIIRNTCKRRTQITSIPPVHIDSSISVPVEVSVGGATVFVVDVDRFEKL